MFQLIISGFVRENYQIAVDKVRMTDYGKYSDGELTAFLKWRDHASFTEIYDRFWQPMFIYALKRLRDEDQAADVIQDLFTQVWKRADQLNIDTDVKEWKRAGIRGILLQLISNFRKGGRMLAYSIKHIKNQTKAD